MNKKILISTTCAGNSLCFHNCSCQSGMKPKKCGLHTMKIGRRGGVRPRGAVDENYAKRAERVKSSRRLDAETYSKRETLIHRTVNIGHLCITNYSAMDGNSSPS